MQTATKKITIKSSKVKINLFEPYKQRNRRLTAWEQQEEKEIAGIFKRPERHFLLDTPTYPYFPITPIIPKINFDLMYKD